MSDEAKKIVHKVEQLLALAAGSHSSDEQRTAALAAAKLIKQHRLIVIHPELKEELAKEWLSGRQPSLPQNEGETGFGQWADEVIAEIFQGVRPPPKGYQRVDPFAKQQRSNPRPPPQADVSFEDASGYGACHSCRGPISKGHRIARVVRCRAVGPAVGSYHIGCYDEAVKQAK